MKTWCVIRGGVMTGYTVSGETLGEALALARRLAPPSWPDVDVSRQPMHPILAEQFQDLSRLRVVTFAGTGS